jgi:hypothetical protein
MGSRLVARFPEGSALFRAVNGQTESHPAASLMFLHWARLGCRRKGVAPLALPAANGAIAYILGKCFPE